MSPQTLVFFFLLDFVTTQKYFIINCQLLKPYFISKFTNNKVCKEIFLLKLTKTKTHHSQLDILSQIFSQCHFSNFLHTLLNPLSYYSNNIPIQTHKLFKLYLVGVIRLIITFSCQRLYLTQMHDYFKLIIYS